MSAPVPLAAQLACAKRELALRTRVYPRRGRAGRMAPAQAEAEYAAMAAVVETLAGLVAAEQGQTADQQCTLFREV